MGTRRERVILELQDDLTPGLARAAVVSKALDKELNRLAGNTTSRADSSINQLTGRLRLATDAALLLGPALVPIGAVGFAGLLGLTNQLGLAAIAGGTALVAFQGVGDALGAINEARLDPTIKNFEKVNEAMSRLGPDTQNLVSELGGFSAAWEGVRDSVASNLFSEVVDNFDNLYGILPGVENLLGGVASVLGEVASSGIESLSSDRWADFFDSLAVDAPQQLGLLASTVGDLAHGLGELWTAFGPLNNTFSGWIADVADSFDSWASGLEGSQGLNQFFSYLSQVGPKVADAMGAVGNALVDIALAAAPLGGASLQVIQSFAEAISALASSGAGTTLLAVAAGLAAVNRAMAIAGVKSTGGYFGNISGGMDKARSSVRSFSADFRNATDGLVAFGADSERIASGASAIRSRLAAVGKVAGPIAGASLAMSGLAEDTGFANTATFALMGSFAGLPGVVGGAAVGALMDAAAANDDVAAAADAAAAAVAALPSNFAAANEAIFTSKTALDSFKESLNPEGFNNPLAGGDFLDIASTKNAIEGLFGKSDVEEAEEAHAKATAAFNESAEAVAQFASEAGMGDVDTSNLFELQRAANVLGPAFAAAGTDFKTFLDMFNDPRTRPEALQEWKRIAPEVRAELRQMGYSGRGSFEQIAQEAQEATDAIRRTADAVGALDSSLSRISGAVGLAEAIGALKDIPKGATFNINTDKGRANIEALVNVGEAAKGQLETLIDAGQFNRADATVDRTLSTLRNFRTMNPASAKFLDPIIQGLERLDRQIERRRQIKIDNKAARDAVANSKKDLANLHRQKAEPKIDANKAPFDGKKSAVDRGLRETDGKKANPLINALDRASSILNGVLGLLGRVDGYTAQSTVTNTIITEYKTVRSVTDALPDRTPQADGGFVPKTGRPYADRHPYLLADGEGVTTNRHGETDRFRDVIAGINNGLSRSQVKGMLADGGFVGRSSPSVTIPAPSLSERDVRRIADAVASGAYRGTSAGVPGAARHHARTEIDAQSRWEREQARD